MCCMFGVILVKTTFVCPGAYVSVLAGGGGVASKLDRSIDDTLIQPKFVG